MPINYRDIIYIIDASLSMGKGVADFRPNKLSTIVEIVANDAMTRLKKSKTRVGLVAFYGLAIPILPPTNDISMFTRSLALLNMTGEGSAPGDAIIEATKLLRNSVRKKGVIIITDGDLNMGAPLELAVIFAVNNNVETCVITIGGSRERIAIRRQLDLLSSAHLINWIHAETRSETVRALRTCFGD